MPSLRSSVLPGILCLALAGHAWASNIESGPLHLSVDDATGDAVSLTRDGTEFLADGGSPLFRLCTTNEAGETVWLSARDAAGVAVNADDDSVVIGYAGIGHEALSAKVTIRPEDEGLSFSIEIDHDLAQGAVEGTIVEEVLFPELWLKPTLGDDPADDCILAPWGDGVLLTRRLIDRLEWSPARAYPGQSSMQFVSMFDPEGGLVLSCHDDSGEAKVIGYQKRDDAIALRISVQRPYVRNVPFESPPFVLQACDGSWVAAAETYRTWAREQWWSKLDEEARSPAWLREMPMILDISLRPLGNGTDAVPLDEVGAWADTWAEALGAPSAAVMLRSWENHGIYVMPNCLPVNPSPEAIRAITDDLHARGHHTMSMVAGQPWTIKKEGLHTPHYNVLPYDGSELFAREAAKVCTVDKAGALNQTKAYFTWDGDRAYMCPALNSTVELYRNVAAELARCGIDLFEFDQMNGGGMALACYSKQHGHPPGSGPWVAQAIRRLYKEAREAGRRENPQFGLAQEEAGELYLDLLDTFCGRNHMLTGWPAMGEGSVVVPAFSVVYRAVKPEMEIDANMSSLPPDSDMAEAMRVEGLISITRTFAWGRMPWVNLRPWEIMAQFGDTDAEPLPERMEADQLELLRHAGATLWGPAREFCTYGEMSPVDLPLTLPTWQVAQEGGAPAHSEPAVRLTRYEHDGRVGYLAINSADEAVRASAFAKGLDLPVSIIVHTNGQDGKPVSRDEWLAGELLPRDVVWITAGPGA